MDKEKTLEILAENIQKLDSCCEDCPFHSLDSEGYITCTIEMQTTYIDGQGEFQEQKCELTQEKIKEILG